MKKSGPGRSGPPISLRRKTLLAVDDEGNDEGVDDKGLDEDECQECHRANRAARAGIPRNSFAGRYSGAALRERAAEGGERDRRGEVAPSGAAAGLHGVLGEGEIREQEGERREGAGREDSLQHVGGSFRFRKNSTSCSL